MTVTRSFPEGSPFAAVSDFVQAPRSGHWDPGSGADLRLERHSASDASIRRWGRGVGAPACSGASFRRAALGHGLRVAVPRAASPPHSCRLRLISLGGGSTNPGGRIPILYRAPEHSGAGSGAVPPSTSMSLPPRTRASVRIPRREVTPGQRGWAAAGAWHCHGRHHSATGYRSRVLSLMREVRWVAGRRATGPGHWRGRPGLGVASLAKAVTWRRAA